MRLPFGPDLTRVPSETVVRVHRPDGPVGGRDALSVIEDMQHRASTEEAHPVGLRAEVGRGPSAADLLDRMLTSQLGDFEPRPGIAPPRAPAFETVDPSDFELGPACPLLDPAEEVYVPLLVDVWIPGVEETD